MSDGESSRERDGVRREHPHPSRRAGERPISEFPDLVQAFACVKQAAERANGELGSVPSERAALIDAAAEEIENGLLLDQFVVDVMQGGAGTSTNMNVNEVIANRGLELGGHQRGEYGHLSPLDDVNRSQSTNDTYLVGAAVRAG